VLTGVKLLTFICVRPVTSSLCDVVWTTVTLYRKTWCIHCVLVEFVNTERSTPIGQIIDHYLQQRMELEDHSIHLLFSANRWELS